MSGNQYAEYVLTDLRSDVDIRINADMALRRFDLSSACPLVAKDTTTCDFLKSERYLEKDDPRIVAVANAIGGKDEIDIIRNVYNYVTSHIVYKGYVPEDEGAVKVLFERGYGDCSDFSDSLAALARAKNIPARDVDGFLTSYGGDNPCHTWVEIYTDKYGWVPFDPLLGNLKQARFDRLAPQYIYLSDLRNDPTLDGFHFFACSYEGSPVNVSSTYSIKTNATNVMTLTRN
jgi:transglutaminase-like putative cysteine protease